MSKLTDKLRKKASFRGVPFYIDGGDRSAGRRVQVQEYPQRDEPYLQDMGRATRELNVTGFTVGINYVEDAEKLADALEQPGAGTLIHPWLGSMEVTLKEPARFNYSRALGQATISMLFVKGGGLNFPAVSDSTQKQSAISADVLGQAAADDFGRTFKVSGQPDWVAAAAAVDINRVFQTLAQPKIPGLGVLNFANTALSSAEQILRLVNDPVALGRKMLSLLGVQDIFSQITLGASHVQAVNRLSGHAQFQPVQTPVSAAAATKQQYANTNALNALTSRVLVAQAVGASSLMPVTVYNDAVAVRDSLVASLDAAALTAPDYVYLALVDSRTKVWKDLTQRARDAARLLTYTPPETMPLLAVACEYYGDAGRADEISARNDIRHPLFVPPAPLKMLSV